jgi:Protein of unknown function (DUF433)
MCNEHKTMNSSDLATIDPASSAAHLSLKKPGPVKTLFEELEGNYSLDEFLECFPSITREMAHNVLARSDEAFLALA